jgi:hypothetical protein
MYSSGSTNISWQVKHTFDRVKRLWLQLSRPILISRTTATIIVITIPAVDRRKLGSFNLLLLHHFYA